MAGIAAGLELNVFRIHIAFNCGQMADDIGKAEFAFSIAPVKLFRGNTCDDFQRALADFFPVVVVPETGDSRVVVSSIKQCYCMSLMAC